MIEVKLGIENLCERIDEHNERTEESHRRSASDLAENMAEDLYKPLKQAMDGRDNYMPSFGYNRKYAEGYDKINWSLL